MGEGALPQRSVPGAPRLGFPPPTHFLWFRAHPQITTHPKSCFCSSRQPEMRGREAAPGRLEWALLMWKEPALRQDTLGTGVVSFLPPVASFPVAEQWPLTQAVIFSLVTPVSHSPPPLAGITWKRDVSSSPGFRC